VPLVNVAVLLGSAVFLLIFFWWFFWSKREATVSAITTGGVQEVMIAVKGGYAPDHVIVRHGQAVRLNFRREEDSACTDRVVIPEFRISKALPAFETTAVEFTPEKPGDYSFTCGMGMIHGKLTVT
jgi:plastocyanin domain-containing protein